ncbi:MAG TPA: zinc-ribbon domain-containing transport protein [Thermoanaerobaculia bacterium]|nr:zinc-ribbon domain-containing transport protein [Thermoanaerobaculia bacterium]
MKRRRIAIWWLAFAAMLVAATLFARVGGGEGYSGGGDSGGGGGGDGSGELLYWAFRFLWWLTVNHPAIGIPVDIVVAFYVWRWYRKRDALKRSGPTGTIVSVSPTTARTTTATERATRELRALREHDANFSEVVFTDFCYSLFARAHHARGQRKLRDLAPYLSDAARHTLDRLTVSGLRGVEGIVIGSFSTGGLRGLEGAMVEVDVEFEANYTELQDEPHGYFVRERWTLERARDLLSPEPGKAKADHCPQCGAALQTRTDGACSFCGTRITSGQFQWFVRTIDIQQRSEYPPNLISSAPERGTHNATRYQTGFQKRWQQFTAAHHEFDLKAFAQRVTLIAQELNRAWSERDWERSRAYETDALFQMHRYWIDEYKRQGVRNTVDQYAVTSIEPVKVTSDAFYDAITVRIGGAGFDYTEDESGKVLAGSKLEKRIWTEYWTLIRGRGTTHKPSTTTANCPNCGAPLQVSETGICAHCGGKVTSGEFDWILSKIEQDESYGG